MYSYNRHKHYILYMPRTRYSAFSFNSSILPAKPKQARHIRRKYFSHLILSFFMTDKSFTCCGWFITFKVGSDKIVGDHQVGVLLYNSNAFSKRWGAAVKPRPKSPATPWLSITFLSKATYSALRLHIWSLCVSWVPNPQPFMLMSVWWIMAWTPLRHQIDDVMLQSL